MKLLLDYDLAELTELCLKYKQPKFRAAQLFEWLYRGADFADMTNLSKAFIAQLSEDFIARAVNIESTLVASDGTRKYLFRLSDGNIIEGVLMKYKYGYTVCVSTQVGCRMGCAFCASGIDGLVRNLSAGEIVGQVVAVNADLGGGERLINNIVLMGSGEPLDNYKNVIKFLNLINSEKGLNISRRNISLSTCGLCEAIRNLANDGGGVNLTVSLHAPNDEIRKTIMPTAKKFKVKDIMSAARYYFQVTGRRVIFEYALIQGVNDSAECALELASIMRGMSCHINLIKLNYVKEKRLKGTSNEEVKKFLKLLEENGCSVTLRRSMGQDVNGACGQLRRGYLAEEQSN